MVAERKVPRGRAVLAGWFRGDGRDSASAVCGWTGAAGGHRPRVYLGPHVARTASADVELGAWAGRDDARPLDKASSLPPPWAYQTQLAPDGRHILYMRARGAWISDARGRRRRPLSTKCDRYFGGLSWSPDGRRILCESTTGLVVLDRRGNLQRTLAQSRQLTPRTQYCATSRK